MNVTSEINIVYANGVDVIPRDELDWRLKSGVTLRVKLGFDPTAPDIHLGHAVVLKKLRQFQDLGHLAVLVIGDYTARVGDPSGRSKTRPILSPEEIEENTRTYLEQAYLVLERDKTEVRHNRRPHPRTRRLQQAVRGRGPHKPDRASVPAHAGLRLGRYRC